MAKDIDQFKNQKGHICEQCMRRRERQGLKNEREQQKIKAEICRIIEELNGGQADVPSIGMLATGMVAKFGGVDGFLTAWYDDIQTMRESVGPKGPTKSLMDQYHAIAKMCHLAQEQRRNSSGLAQMSDEEIDALTRNLLVQRVQESSEDAIEMIAAARGMKLVPMDDADASPLEGEVLDG